MPSSRIPSDLSNISLNALNRSYFNMAHVEARDAVVANPV